MSKTNPFDLSLVHKFKLQSFHDGYTYLKCGVSFRFGNACCPTDYFPEKLPTYFTMVKVSVNRLSVPGGSGAGKK